MAGFATELWTKLILLVLSANMSTFGGMHPLNKPIGKLLDSLKSLWPRDERIFDAARSELSALLENMHLADDDGDYDLFLGLLRKDTFRIFQRSPDSAL